MGNGFGERLEGLLVLAWGSVRTGTDKGSPEAELRGYLGWLGKMQNERVQWGDKEQY